MTPKGLFITGTDTGTGKTVIGAALADRLFRNHVDVQPRKPVESGCIVDDTKCMLPEDGLAYYRAVDKTIALDVITPYRYPAALAPPQAARLHGQTIELDQLDAAVQKDLKPSSYCIVEGAGGFYSPIADQALNADLAVRLKLPVLLVAADRLGCISHVLLTLQAIASRGLECIGVVLNRTDSTEHHPGMNNVEAIREAVSIPLFEVGYSDTLPVSVEALCTQLQLP